MLAISRAATASSRWLLPPSRRAVLLQLKAFFSAAGRGEEVVGLADAYGR